MAYVGDIGPMLLLLQPVLEPSPLLLQSQRPQPVVRLHRAEARTRFNGIHGCGVRREVVLAVVSRPGSGGVRRRCVRRIVVRCRRASVTPNVTVIVTIHRRVLAGGAYVRRARRCRNPGVVTLVGDSDAWRSFCSCRATWRTRLALHAQRCRVRRRELQVVVVPQELGSRLHQVARAQVLLPEAVSGARGGLRRPARGGGGGGGRRRAADLTPAARARPTGESRRRVVLRLRVQHVHPRGDVRPLHLAAVFVAAAEAAVDALVQARVGRVPG